MQISLYVYNAPNKQQSQGGLKFATQISPLLNYDNIGTMNKKTDRQYNGHFCVTNGILIFYSISSFNPNLREINFYEKNCQFIVWGPKLWAVLKNGGSANRPRIGRLKKLSTLSPCERSEQGSLLKIGIKKFHPPVQGVEVV